MALLQKYMTTLALVLAPLLSTAQQIKARVSGLENNAEYMELLHQEQTVSAQADSLSLLMERMRRSFRTDTAAREQIAVRILESEEKLFALRNRVGILSQQINAIEQQWIIMHLNDDAAAGNTEPEPQKIQDTRKSVNLAYDSRIRENLPEQDYLTLLSAQRNETRAGDLAAELAALIRECRVTALQYDTVSTEARASELMTRFDSLSVCCSAAEDSLSRCWAYIFDNKIYAYSYIADKNNRPEIIAELGKTLEDMQAETNMQRGRWASDEMVSYLLQKRVVGSLEQQIAQMFALDMAGDSLQRAASALADTDFFLPKVDLKERLFLDYEALSIHSPSIYNSRNPIPECRIYERGTIYRIQLGSFSVQQTPALFKGVAPLSYVRENGRYVYFAGGFAADSSARQAQIELKDLGFKRPEVVVWNDGVYRNLTRDGAQPAQADTTLYRVIIKGIESVDDSLRIGISAVAERFDILRSGQNFIIAPVEGASRAERIRDIIIRRYDSSSAEIEPMEN